MSNHIPERAYLTLVPDMHMWGIRTDPSDIEYIRAEAVEKERDQARQRIGELEHAFSELHASKNIAVNKWYSRLTMAEKERDDLKSELQSLKAEVDRKNAHVKDLESRRECIRAFIPDTFGDAIQARWVPLGDLPGHEWDNSTSEENAIWVITRFREELASVRAGAAQLAEELGACKRERDAMFANPLTVLFGTGRIEICHFEQDRTWSLVFRDSGAGHEIGTPSATPRHPHTPQRGEVYLRFPNAASAIAVYDTLRELIQKIDPSFTDNLEHQLIERTRERDAVESHCSDVEKERDSFKQQLTERQAFKDYVHKRLDDAGVPSDPESAHKAEGCRIGGRLDHLFHQLTEKSELCERLKEFIRWMKQRPEADFHMMCVAQELLQRAEGKV